MFGIVVSQSPLWMNIPYFEPRVLIIRDVELRTTGHTVGGVGHDDNGEEHGERLLC